ncbi:MAG: biotin--[acetyl-CoA-carboxylase] ligase, partial [Thermodesulfobacteriota bacterium]
VNLNMSGKFILKVMPDIAGKVTSLSNQLGKRADREKFSADLINNIDRFYIKFLEFGNSAILSDWNQRWEARGSEIEVNDGKKSYKGIAERVDENGFLYLKKADGNIEKVITGDVRF